MRHRARADVPHRRARGRGVQGRLRRATGSGAASRSWSSTRTATRTTAASSSTTAASSRSTTASSIRGCRSSRGSRATSASRCATGRTACKLALIICHDGMFPEMARECAYKGAEIMLRTAGYTAPIRHAWQHHQPGQRVPQPDACTASVCLCGSDGTFDSMGEGMFCNFDGTRDGRGRRPRPTRSSPAKCGPTWCAKRAPHWGVENNIYQLGHRGYVAVKGGAHGLPVHVHARHGRGRYRLPWEDEVRSRRRHVVRLRAADATHAPTTCARAAAERAQGGVTTMSALAADRTTTSRRHADPYPWPYDGDLRPANTALVVIDMQTDFCGVGGYVDKMGYDLSLTRAPIEPISEADGAHARARLSRSSTRAKAIAPTWPTCPPTSAGARAASARRRRHRRRRAVRPHPGARRAGLGDHPRARAAARRSRHRQARQGLVLRHRPRADPAHARHRAT